VDVQSFEALTLWTPKVFQVNLEDHEKAQDIICFDFVPALLSLLQN
jgi:hypothetical protein